MSLWTPYVPEAPLDLSKASVKQERHSPINNMGVIVEPAYPYMAPVPDAAIPGPYYPGYLPYTVHSAPISPVSGGSTCSGFEVTVNAPCPRPATLSPPESPPSKSVKVNGASVNSNNYMADADWLSDDPDFQAFERDALRAMAERNGGSLLGNNPRMRRAVQGSAGDDAYRRQRERNNHAAKQSRDRRKLREIHLALKVAYLKNEISKINSLMASCGCRKASHVQQMEHRENCGQSSRFSLAGENWSTNFRS